jgi:hypothetical protein
MPNEPMMWRRRTLLGAALAVPWWVRADGGAASPGWPGPVTLDYRMSRGLLSGTGRLTWQPEGERYLLRLEARLPLLGTLLTQTSAGRLGPQGLVPERFTDERLRRPARSADFQRPDGPIRFTGRSETAPLQPGMQDRLSWMLQLAWRAQNEPRLREVGRELEMPVVGARGDVDLWLLRALGAQTVTLAGGRTVKAMRYERLPREPGDTRADIWLDPSRHHLPARARLGDAKDEPLELVLVGS